MTKEQGYVHRLVIWKENIPFDDSDIVQESAYGERWLSFTRWPQFTAVIVYIGGDPVPDDYPVGIPLSVDVQFVKEENYFRVIVRS